MSEIMKEERGNNVSKIKVPNKSHRDFELPTDVSYFCQPGIVYWNKYFLFNLFPFPFHSSIIIEGCLTIGPKERRRQQHLRHRLHEANSFVFTLTEKDSGRVYY